MKALIVGAGSIGKRHEQNLKTLGVHDIIFLHHGIGKNQAPHFWSLRQALKVKPDIAIIANPSSLHIPIALALARAGVHLLIEKPLSHNLNNIKKLMVEVKKHKLVAMVGYNFRFHPQVKKIKELLAIKAIGKISMARIVVGQYLPDWHPGEDYRKSYAGRKALGGGPLLTLSHEIDYANWWFGQPKKIWAQASKQSSLEIDTEDIDELLVEYQEGALASIHLDYLARPPVRNTVIWGSEGIITWDYFTNEIKVYNISCQKWTTYHDTSFERNLMFQNEMKVFIAAAKNHQPATITLTDGLMALKVALAADRSNKLEHIINFTA